MVKKSDSEADADTHWQRVIDKFQKVASLARDHQRSASRGTKWLRGGTVIIGGFLAAAAGAFTDPAWPLDRNEILVLVGAFMSLAAGLHDLVFTPTTADETFEASTAAADLLTAQREIEKHKGDGYQAYLIKVRLRELLQSVLSARSIVEDVLTSPEPGDVNAGMRAMLQACQAQLRSAMAFPAGHHWTLCIYRRETDDKGDVLRCVAQDRYTVCDLKDARTFRPGASIPGQVLMRGEAVIVSDLFQEEGESALAVPSSERKPADEQRYRSIAGFPILIGPDDDVWGVVVATCAIPGFFSSRSPEELNPVEVVRVVSEMAATIAATYVRVDSRIGEGDFNAPNAAGQRDSGTQDGP